MKLPIHVVLLALALSIGRTRAPGMKAGFMDGFSACSPTSVSGSDQGQNQDQDHNNGPGPTPTPSATAAPACVSPGTAVTCARFSNPATGSASSFDITHGCGGGSRVTCTRAGDGIVTVFEGVVTGDRLDPGPPGSGAGVWTCAVSGAGSCTVTLDS